jgi:hypothetical protein
MPAWEYSVLRINSGFERETAYAFTSVERLIADFWSDVERVRGEQ